MKYFLTVLFVVMGMSSQVQAKRVAAPVVAPIEFDGVVYTPAFTQENGGFTQYLIAENASDKSVVWKTALYHRDYDKNLEQDVQDIHLKSLFIRGNQIVARDEKGKTYKVLTASGKLLTSLP